MVLPLILLIVLLAGVWRTAQRFDTSATGPMAAAAGLWILFWAGTRGAIRISSMEEVAEGILLALLLYVSVFLVIYFAAFVWVKAKSPAWPREAEAPPPAVAAFRRFLGVHVEAVDWRHALAFLLGLTSTSLVDRIVSSQPLGWEGPVLDLVFVAVLVAGFRFLDRLHVAWVAGIVALLVASARLVFTTFVADLLPLTFATTLVFVLAFLLSTIGLAGWLRRFWVSLGLGYFLAGLVMVLALALLKLAGVVDLPVVAGLLSPRIHLVGALDALALVGVTLLFHRVLGLDAIRVEGG